jgi:RNA polymerase sigma-70 factor (ECF subfamily)
MQPEFLHFFNQCEPDLRAYIGSVVRDVHAQEDVFQDVSRTLWQSFDQYDPERSFGAWARGVATRKMLEARRKNARFPLIFPQETLEAILDAFDADEENQRLQESALQLCLEALPEKSRQILNARYQTGLKCDRIAKQLGMNLKAVHQVLCRLRKGLEECIQHRLANDDFEPRPAPVLTNQVP